MIVIGSPLSMSSTVEKVEMTSTANPLTNVAVDAAEKGTPKKNLFTRLDAYKQAENATWMNVTDKGSVCEILLDGAISTILFCNTHCTNNAESISEMCKIKADVWRVVREPVDFECTFSVDYAPVTSTNDFIVMRSAPRSLKFLGSVILLIQIAMMILAIANSYGTGDSDLTTTLIFVRFFISAYLGFKMANCLSDSVDGMFSSMLNGVYGVQFEGDDNDQPVLYGLLKIAMGVLIVTVLVPISYVMFVMLSCFHLYAHIIGDPSQSSDPLGEVWNFLLVSSEYTLITVSVLATIVITRQQSGLVESIFNFVGLLLILELDDLVASSIKYHVREMRIECLHTSELKINFFTHKNIVGGLVMVVTFIAVVI